MSKLELRVSDADRDQAVVTLREAHVEGRLTLAEFSERAGLAYAARGRAELEQVTADLPAAAPPSRKRPRRLTFAIFAGPTLRGRWRAARRMLVVTIFGGADLDLRNARLDGGGLTIFSLSLFGGTDFYVPQGIEVDLIGLGLFGHNDENGTEGEIHPGSPLVRIITVSLFAGTDVWHVPPGAGDKLRDMISATRRGVGGPPQLPPPPAPPRLPR